MFYKSIRFKITILYMAILALTLTSFSVILYHNVSRGLYDNMDILLTSKAGGISQAINAYWEASNLEALEYGVKSEILNKRRNANFAKVAQLWVREESVDPKLLDIFVRVFDTDGNKIASSKKMEELLEIPARDFLSVLQGKSRFDTISPGNMPTKVIFRIYTTPVFENEKVAYIVQVATTLDSIQIALNKLKVALFLLFPVTVLVTGVLGAFLAKVTLHPVDSMIKTIHQITAENLKLSLKIPDTKDEIQDLAETFNSMLGRLEHAFTSQRQLFEDLSHELKTPLTILKGELEVTLKKLRTSQEYESVMRSSLEEINKIINLSENLLMLAKFDLKQIVPERKEINLSLLVQGITNSIKGLAELKRIKISFKPDYNASTKGDEAQLRTLFRNIVDNAVKYTPPDGSISIMVEKNGSKAKVRISDTGIGIPKREIPHIFDRFYRIDKSRSSGAGFGLGLSISKSIAEVHNGRIDVESEPGRGTAFTIHLPSSQT